MALTPLCQSFFIVYIYSPYTTLHCASYKLRLSEISLDVMCTTYVRQAVESCMGGWTKMLYLLQKFYAMATASTDEGSSNVILQSTVNLNTNGSE